MSEIKLAVLDVAGTTAKDGGLVVQAFLVAMEPLGLGQTELDSMVDYVNATMGQRKIDVLMHLCNSDEVAANAAHDRFVEAYSNLVAEGLLEEFEGISELFRALRSKGVGVAITTGFPRSILDFIIEDLNWAELLDLSVAASEVNEGRPAPDMILRAISLYNEKFGTEVKPANVIVVGDTDSDIQAGLRAEAALVVGVTSGACTRAQLENSGATHILDFSTQIVELI